jgi:hypothetical protein
VAELFDLYGTAKSSHVKGLLFLLDSMMRFFWHRRQASASTTLFVQVKRINQNNVRGTTED